MSDATDPPCSDDICTVSWQGRDDPAKVCVPFPGPDSRDVWVLASAIGDVVLREHMKERERCAKIAEDNGAMLVAALIRGETLDAALGRGHPEGTDPSGQGPT